MRSFIIIKLFAQSLNNKQIIIPHNRYKSYVPVIFAYNPTSPILSLLYYPIPFVVIELYLLNRMAVNEKSGYRPLSFIKPNRALYCEHFVIGIFDLIL